MLYIFLALALCGLLATLAYLLSLSTSQDTEKRSEYECGFAPFDSATRLPFDVHFYLVGILFLIFDVEVALLFPWVLSLNTVGWFGFYLMIAFLFILSVGFLYEWKRGALIWPARYTATQTDLSSAKWLAPVGAVFSSNFLELARIEDFSVTFIDFFLPEVALAAMVIYLLTVVALELGEGRSKLALSPESWTAMCACLATVSGLLMYQLLVGISTSPALHGYFSVGCGADLLKLLTGVSTLLVLVASGKYLKEHYQHTLEYSIMVALALWFMLLLVQANHLISAFLCIVGFSLNLYVLILYDIAVRPSREAGLKYYYLSTLSSGLILYGAFLLYALSGSGEFGELYMFFLRDELRYSELARAAVMLTIFGVFFKLSAVPAHLWAVEVYEGSPSPITALFMLPVKVAVLALFIRLLTLALSGLSHFWTAPLLFVVSASLLWGAFAATYERNTKRFLGYASINQIGYLLLGLGCGTDVALRSSISYLAVYVVMSAAFLLIFIYARRTDNFNLNYTSDFRGLAKQEWIASWTLAIVLFSMAGIPPLAGFYAKYVVLVSAMEQNLYFPAIVALATSLLGAFYYLRFIRAFWFEDTTSVAPVLCEMTRAQRAGLSLIEIFLWGGALIGPALLPFLGRAVTSLMSLPFAPFLPYPSYTCAFPMQPPPNFIPYVF